MNEPPLWGRGFLESIYEAALAEELAVRGTAFEQQVSIPIVHLAQTLSYLHAGAFPLGLILNFSMFSMKEGIRRVIPL